MTAADIPQEEYDLAAIKSYFFDTWMMFGYELCETHGVHDLREKQKVFQRFIKTLEKFRR